MPAFLRRHRLLLLIVTTAAALAYLSGPLAALALLAVALAIYEHHLRMRMTASFRNLRRCLALETQRNDAIQDYLDGILAAARGDADDTPTGFCTDDRGTPCDPPSRRQSCLQRRRFRRPFSFQTSPRPAPLRRWGSFFEVTDGARTQV